MAAAVYEIRDPVHRTILVDESERRVLDHPWIQRLRHIRQLGFVSTVYPGGIHDRFQHSVGVMHLAGSCLRQVLAGSSPALAGLAARDRELAVRLIRLAGLLHDAGHAPFSHTTEAWFPKVEALPLLPEAWYRPGHRPCGRQADHEDLGLAVIHGLVGEGVLDGEDGRDVAAILSADIQPSPRFAALGPLPGILRALVSGEMDADRCDYLLRDSHFTGVSYGVYDLPRLQACLCVLEGPEGPELGMDAHGIFALESLLLARYHMFHQVYFHKTPPAFEYYLGQAIEAGEVRFSLAAGVADLVELRDDSIISQLHAARRSGGEWSRRILDREPAKLVLRERVGADQPENFLSQVLVDSLREEGCVVFVRRSRQRFTRIAGAGAGDAEDGVRLLCERRILGRPLVEPVTRHSDLLAAFNQPIDLQHTYVLRKDADRARRVMDRLHVW